MTNKAHSDVSSDKHGEQVPTPRTDAAVSDILCEDGIYTEMVNPGFARQLERELAEVKDRLARYVHVHGAHLMGDAETPSSMGEPAAYLFGAGQPLLPDGLTDEQKKVATPLYHAHVSAIKSPSAEAIKIAHETLGEPDARARVKVQLAIKVGPSIADMVDEMVVMAREILRLANEPERKPT